MLAVPDLSAGPLGRVLALSILCKFVGLLSPRYSVPLDRPLRSRQNDIGWRPITGAQTGIAAEIPALRARLAELQSTGTMRDVALDGASDALASANLQSRIEQLAKENGVTITSTEAIPAEDRAPYRRIGLRLTVTRKYEAVVNLLAAMAEAQPPIVVGNLQMYGLFRAIEARANHALDTRFEVYGLRRRPND